MSLEGRNDHIAPWLVTWSLGVTSLESVSAYAEEATYPAGTTIFSRGDMSDAMYLVLEGTVLILIQDDNGTEQTASIVSTGQSFGEVGLLINQQRLATAVAGIDLKLLKITHDALVRLEVEEPAFMVKVYKRLAQTLAEQWMLSATEQAPPIEYIDNEDI
jgi:CRP/FNR family transcriptional regulator, cyclic AMP receptor protein